PIALPASLQRAQALHLIVGRRGDELAALLVRDPVLLAEAHHALDAFADEDRLERAWRVMQSRVEHPGVVRRLMHPHVALLLQDEHAEVASVAEQAVGGCERDDAAT